MVPSTTEPNNVNTQFIGHEFPEAEIMHKDFGADELSQNERQTEEKEGQKTDLLSKMEELQATINRLTDEINTMKADIGDLQLNMKRVSENWETVSRVFQTTDANTSGPSATEVSGSLDKVMPPVPVEPAMTTRHAPPPHQPTAMPTADHTYTYQPSIHAVGVQAFGLRGISISGASDEALTPGRGEATLSGDSEYEQDGEGSFAEESEESSDAGDTESENVSTAGGVHHNMESNKSSDAGGSYTDSDSGDNHAAGSSYDVLEDASVLAERLAPLMVGISDTVLNVEEMEEFSKMIRRYTSRIPPQEILEAVIQIDMRRMLSAVRINPGASGAR